MATPTSNEHNNNKTVHRQTGCDVMGWDVKKGEMGADKRKTRTSNQTKRAVGEGAVSELSVSAPRSRTRPGKMGARDTSLVLLPERRFGEVHFAMLSPALAAFGFTADPPEFTAGS